MGAHKNKGFGKNKRFLESRTQLQRQNLEDHILKVFNWVFEGRWNGTSCSASNLCKRGANDTGFCCCSCCSTVLLFWWPQNVLCSSYFFGGNTLLCIDLRFSQDPIWQKTLVSKQLTYFWFWLYLRDRSRTGSFGLHPAKHFNEWDYSFNAGCPLLTTMMPNLMKHGLWYHDANSALLYIT